MRATMGITWLLLLLSHSFLFHSVCSEDAQADPTVPKSAKNGTTAPDGADLSTKPPTDGNATAAPTATAKTTDDAGKDSNTIQNPTSAKPTVAVTAADGSLAATSKPTDKPVPDQTTASIIEKPATPSIAVTGPDADAATDATQGQAPAATSQQPPAATSQQPPAATSASNSTSVVSAKPDTVQMPDASGSSKASETVAPPTSNVKTTMIPNVSTDGAPGQQPPAQTTAAAKTSQPDSQGGIESKTGPVTSPVQTASSGPSPAGNPGTTGVPSILTTSGTAVTVPPGTKDGTMSLQTTRAPAKATTPTTTTAATTTTASTATTASTTTTATTAAPPKTFSYALNSGHENKEEKELVEVCKRLLVNFQDGDCSLTWTDSNGTKVFGEADVKGKVKGELVTRQYEEITKVKKPTDNKTLIAILASCGALLIMIVILAVCASHHRKPYNENQQHLTDELHTVENGYHDNPTLEVMEAQPEMQEKKMALNGEFNDSWIVPMDNLLKEDMPDEEDTHL